MLLCKTNRKTECVEWKWGKVTKLIADEKIHLVDNLGINVCPGSNDYFMVYTLEELNPHGGLILQVRYQ